MWLLHLAHGFLVWPVLVKSVTSLPTSFRSVDAWSFLENEDSSVKVKLNMRHLRRNVTKKSKKHEEVKVQIIKSKHLPKLPVSHHGPGPPDNETLPWQHLRGNKSHASRSSQWLAVKSSEDNNASLGGAGGRKKPLALHSSSSTIVINNSIEKTWAITAFAVAMFFAIVIIFVSDQEDWVEVGAADTKSEEQKSEISPRAANTKANLLKLEAMDCNGTWVKTYRHAEVGTKLAMELLFRCNIITMDEFAHSYVTQEHIEECVWISAQMLREKSLDHWVEDWPQAVKTFEESVTACFAARTDVIANLFEMDKPQRTPRSQNVLHPTGTHMEVSPAFSTLSDRGFMDAAQPPSPVGPMQRMRSNPSTTRSTGPVASDPYTTRSTPQPLVSDRHLVSDRGFMDAARPPPSPVAPIHRLYSNPSGCGSTVDAVTESQASWSAPQPRPYNRPNVNTLLHDLDQQSPLDRQGRETSPAPMSNISSAGSLHQLLSHEPGRNSVVARCREIMREAPTRSQWQSVPAAEDRGARFDARRPQIGDVVIVVDTEATRKWFAHGIGKQFRIRTDHKSSETAPYQLEGSNVWLQETDLELVAASGVRWGSVPAAMGRSAPFSTSDTVLQHKAGATEVLFAAKGSPIPASSMDPFNTTPSLRDPVLRGRAGVKELPLNLAMATSGSSPPGSASKLNWDGPDDERLPTAVIRARERALTMDLPRESKR